MKCYNCLLVVNWLIFGTKRVVVTFVVGTAYVGIVL